MSRKPDKQNTIACFCFAGTCALASCSRQHRWTLPLDLSEFNGSQTLVFILHCTNRPNRTVTQTYRLIVPSHRKAIDIAEKGEAGLLLSRVPVNATLTPILFNTHHSHRTVRSVTRVCALWFEHAKDLSCTWRHLILETHKTLLERDFQDSVVLPAPAFKIRASANKPSFVNRRTAPSMPL